MLGLIQAGPNATLVVVGVLVCAAVLLLGLVVVLSGSIEGLRDEQRFVRELDSLERELAANAERWDPPMTGP